MRELTDSRVSPISIAVTAGVAGAVSRVAVNVLGTTKTMGAVGVPGGNSGTFNALYWLHHEAGCTQALTRGAQLSAVRAIGHYGIMFGTYHQLAQAFVHKNKGELLTVNSLIGTIAAGGASSVAATLVTHPLDVARTRFVIAPLNGHVDAYKSELGTMGEILAKEGIPRGIYRGITLSVTGSAIWGAALFTALEIADNVPWYTAQKRVFISPTIDKLIYLSAAVTGAAYAVYPFEVLKQKYMAASPILYRNGGCNVPFNNMLELLIGTWQRGGLYQFYQGAFSLAVRVPIQIAIFATIFKLSKIGLPPLEYQAA